MSGNESTEPASLTNGNGPQAAPPSNGNRDNTETEPPNRTGTLNSTETETPESTGNTTGHKDETISTTSNKPGELSASSVTTDVNAKNHEVEPSDGRGVAKVPPSGEPGRGERPARERSSSRSRSMTGKGAAYAREQRQRAFEAAVSKWQKAATQIEITIADSQDTSEIKSGRDKLLEMLNVVEHTFFPLKELLNRDEHERLTAKVDYLRSENLAVIKRVTDCIRDLEFAIRSAQSRSSKRSTSTRSSSSSWRRAAAAAEAAALQTKLKYIGTESRKKAELEELQTKIQLEIANAKVAALDNGSMADHSEEVQDLPCTSKKVDLNVDAPPFHPITWSDNTPTPRQQQVADVDKLAESFVEQVQVSRVPIPEPCIFYGDSLHYSSWKHSFDILIDNRRIPEVEKLFYLKRYLGGAAKEAVDGYLLMPRDKLEAWPKVGDRDGLALRKFADFLGQCKLAMRDNPTLSILNDDRENGKLVAKLPEWLAKRWIRSVSDYKGRFHEYPPFHEFVSFLRKEATIACEHLAINKKQPQPQKSGEVKNTMQKGRNFAIMSEQQPRSVDNCLMCHKSHSVNDCHAFLKKTLDERRSWVKQQGLCFGCLQHGHTSHGCRAKLTCKTCSSRHPTSLHDPSFKPKPHTSAPPSNVPAGTATTTQDTGEKIAHSGFTAGQDVGASYHATMIVPVMLSHCDDPTNEVLVYAMLDTQSDTTFLLASTRQSLGIEGHHTTLTLSTITSERQKVQCRKLDGLSVRGYNQDVAVTLPTTFTRRYMPVDRSHIPTSDTARNWPHLHHIANKLSPLLDCEVGLLIGYDCPKALAPREVISHESEGPYAQRSDLGWGIIGMSRPVEVEGDNIGISHRILRSSCPSENPGRTELVVWTTMKESLCDSKSFPSPKDIANMMALDFVEHGVGPPASQNDLKFMEIMESGIHLAGNGHYEMPSPLKSESLNFPKNRFLAERRLDGLKRKLIRSDSMHKDYTAFMQQMID